MWSSKYPSTDDPVVIFSWEVFGIDCESVFPMGSWCNGYSREWKSSEYRGFIYVRCIYMMADWIIEPHIMV